MALNKDDSKHISYRAKIEWLKARVVLEKNDMTPIDQRLAEAKLNDDFINYISTPDELIEILNDLAIKASKIEARIAYESKGLKIPINQETQPDIVNAVKLLDPESKGEYITYALYDSLLRKNENAMRNIDLSGLIENSTGDANADSMYVHTQFISGIKNTPDSVPGDNKLERYTNRYLNNLFTWNEHDQGIRKVINFSDNYIGISPDPAFIPWRLRQSTGFKRVKSKDLGEFWTNFSDEYKTQKNELLGGMSDLKALKPDPNMHDITKRYISYGNEALNIIDTTFDMNYGADLICCFAMWAGGLNMKTLKAIRAAAQLLRAGLGIEYMGIVNSIIDIINNIMRGLLEGKLMGFLHQVAQRLLDPIKKWINNPDNRWEKIFICTPIDDFVHKYLVQAVEWLEDQLESLIRSFYKRLELEHIKDQAELTLISEQKWIDNIIKMLNMIIASLEKSAICATRWSPTGEDIQRLMRDYKLVPSGYVYPIENKPTIYNSFIKKDGSKLDTPIVDEGVGSHRSEPKINECLRILGLDDIVPVDEWTKL